MSLEQSAEWTRDIPNVTARNVPGMFRGTFVDHSRFIYGTLTDGSVHSDHSRDISGRFAVHSDHSRDISGRFAVHLDHSGDIYGPLQIICYWSISHSLSFSIIKFKSYFR